MHGHQMRSLPPKEWFMDQKLSICLSRSMSYPDSRDREYCLVSSRGTKEVWLYLNLVPSGSKEGMGNPGTGVTDGWELQCEWGE